jgi:benzaldehyde dehydrogenase (NAD)
LELSPWSGRIFVGEWRLAQGGAIDIKEPATGNVLTRVGLANAADIAASANAAAAAQPPWASTPARERADVFHQAAAHLLQNLDEYAGIIARETGGTFLKGQREVREAVASLRAAPGLILQPEGVILPSTPGRVNLAKRVPLGVVGVISPFTFPLILSMRSVAPALAVGNAVVLKPAAETPIAGGFLLALAFQAAGLPPGVLQVLPGDVDAGEALCTDPRVQMIAFTGSTAMGRRVGELAGKHLKKVALGLCGKNAIVILEDAELHLAAKNVTWGAYMHQGQVCMANARVLAHEKVAEALTRLLVEKAKHLSVGDPARNDIGLRPLINERQRDRVHSIVMQAVGEGAKLEAGGAYHGLFYDPTVLSGVRATMGAFREEFFGPVTSVTTFSSDDQAVELANDSEHGPAAAVISRSVRRAMAIADRLKAGLVHINDQTLDDEVSMAFGGTGASGNHTQAGGPADVGEYTQWRRMTIEDAPPPYPF